jgi:hypothetical protein
LIQKIHFKKIKFKRLTSEGYLQDLPLQMINSNPGLYELRLLCGGWRGSGGRQRGV